MNRKRVFISTIGGTPKVKYKGCWDLLDILIEKVREEQDANNIKIYCELFKMIYELDKTLD